MTWNMICVIMALHSALNHRSAFGVKALVATALALRRYRSSGGDVDAIAGSFTSIEPTSAQNDGVPAIVRAFLAPNAAKIFDHATVDDLAEACDADDATRLLAPHPTSSIASCCRFVRDAALSINPAKRWYFASLCVLAAYVGVNVSLSSSSPDSGRSLCVVTAASVLLIDMVVAAMWHGALLHSTGSVTIVSASARIALIAYGTSYWLLGQCTVYAILGIYLSHILAMQRFASGAKIVTLQALFDAGLTSVSPQPRQESLDNATPQRSFFQPRRWAGALLTFVLHPAGLLLCLTVVFTVFVAGLAVAMDRPASTIPNPLVRTLQGRVPQYAFGVGAICVVAIWLCTEITLRLWWRGRRSFDRVGWAFAVISWIVCGVCSGVLGWLTASYVILACGAFLPPLVFALLFGYGRWVLDDYVCFLPGGFGLSKLVSASAISPEAQRNWSMLLSIVFVFGSLCGFGATISTAVSVCLVFSHVSSPRGLFFELVLQVSPGWVGWVAAGSLATFICTALPILQWFGTLEFTWFFVQSLVVATGFHVAVHVRHPPSPVHVLIPSHLGPLFRLL